MHLAKIFPTIEFPFSNSSKAESVLCSILANTSVGTLSLTGVDGETRTFGIPNSAPRAHCLVRDKRFYKAVLTRGSLGLGESYMEGWWDEANDNLVALFKLLFANRLEVRVSGNIILKLRALMRRIIDSPARRSAARYDIERHYDLGNDFFKYMLDESMTYSCGYARSASDTLEQMQEQKYELIYNKLGLDRGGRLVDIGCGWGGMLIYSASRNPKLSGVGITLSRQQVEFARQRIAERGLSDRLEILLCDYRDLTGRFDFLVSIGMFEHVGKKSYGDFFDKMIELLNDKGVALLHTIGLEEDPACGSDPWTEKYIFPGSRLPRLDEIVKHLRRRRSVIRHIENLRPHYALTLQKWRERFENNWCLIRALGSRFDRRFYRMWRYYLSMCEADFSDSTVELYQVLFNRDRSWCAPALSAPLSAAAQQRSV